MIQRNRILQHENHASLAIIMLALAALFILFPSLSTAQATLELSAGPYTYFCQLNAPGPVRTIYVRHTFHTGAAASRFRIEQGPGVTMTYLSETHPFPLSIGDSQTGLSVCYGGCLHGSLIVATIDYMSYGSDQNCSEVLIVPHPDAEVVEVIDCLGISSTAWVREISVGEFCACPDPHTFAGNPETFDCQPLPVESKTWGGVKALYRR